MHFQKNRQIDLFKQFMWAFKHRKVIFFIKLKSNIRLATSDAYMMLHIILWMFGIDQSFQRELKFESHLENLFEKK